MPLSPAAISRETMPPGAVQALEGIFKQLENQVIDPLLYGASPQDLPTAFARQYQRFVPAYMSAILALVSALEHDLQRLVVLSARGFSEAGRTLRERGPDRIGREATTAALLGLDAMTRVVRRAIATPAVVVSAGPAEIVNQWAPVALAHMLTLFAVTSFLSHDEPLRGGAQNATILAHWSKGYASRVYHISKSIGLLTPTAPGDPAPTASDEEDRQLAEAGLDPYRDLLAREDTRDDQPQR